MFNDKVSHLMIASGITLMAVLSSSVLADSLSMRDKRFIKNAAQSGHYEVQASQLATTKASSDEVKKYANHVIEDHNRAASELKALATKKGVEVPDKPSMLQTVSIKWLNTRSGKDFDETYAENIGVEAHKSAVEDFTEAAKNSDDAEVKAFAAKTLPVLKQHMDLAQALEKNTNKTN